MKKKRFFLTNWHWCCMLYMSGSGLSTNHYFLRFSNSFFHLYYTTSHTSPDGHIFGCFLSCLQQYPCKYFHCLILEPNWRIMTLCKPPKIPVILYLAILSPLPNCLLIHWHQVQLVSNLFSDRIVVPCCSSF